MSNLASEREELTDIWSHFIAGKETPDEIKRLNPMVYQSWLRSREHNVDPFEEKVRILEGRSLEHQIRKSAALVDVSRSYMKKLFAFLNEEDEFVILVTDSDSIILDQIGGSEEKMARSKEDTHMRIGACRAENYVGTNGTDLCLHLDKPLQIRGAEHYLQAHHIFTCSASPIHDQNGVVIGALGVIGPVESTDRHTLGMAVAAADGIEKQLRLRLAYDEIKLSYTRLNRTLQAISIGVIMVDPEGNIVHHNKAADKILWQVGQDLNGKKLLKYFRPETDDLNLWMTQKDFFDREVTITLNNGQRISLSLTVCVIQSGERRVGTILTFDLTQKINQVVNRRSGFTARYTFDDIIGNSGELQGAKNLGMIAAENNSTVLILGESGTGKELFAQAIHNASKRSSGPFIAINCGSLPKDLVESEMFGYVSGAYTGASKEGMPGKFELADHGTIFLDEIGDMPLAAQASLLRVLQTKEVVRIGGKKSIPIDVRVIAATNVNLSEQVHNHTFRSDLFYRLYVFPVTLPPLRERKGDIRQLAEYFIQQALNSGDSIVNSISEEAISSLERYQWPGNIRQLQNVIQRSIYINTTGCITPRELPKEILDRPILEAPYGDEPAVIPRSIQARNAPVADIPSLRKKSQKSEEALLRQALAKTGGNLTRAANMLKIPRRTFYRKISQYNIEPSEYRTVNFEDENDSFD